MHIVINVIGNITYGTGHIYRMLRLTPHCKSSIVTLKRFGNIKYTFVVQNKNELCHQILTEHLITPFIYNTIQELDSILSILNPPIDIIINDCLNTNEELIVCEKKYSNKIINFEDYGKGSRKADVVINSFYNENVLSGSNVYVGLSYTLLGNLLLNSEPCEFNKSVKRIILTFGGSDPSNISESILKLLIKHNIHHFIEIIVILGIGYQNKDVINEISNKHQNVIVSVNEKNMIGQFQKSDIAITSCGTAMYEACYLLLPVICIAHHSREMMHTELCLDDTIINMGCFDTFNSSLFMNSLYNLINNTERRKDIRNNITKMRNIISNSFDNIINLIYTQTHF